MYVSLFVCMYVFECMCLHVCDCMYVFVCMCLYVCACMYVLVCMCLNICMYVYLNVRKRGSNFEREKECV